MDLALENKKLKKILKTQSKVIEKLEKRIETESKITEKQSKIIETQSKIIEKLEKAIEDLKEKLNINSKNSSKSPSSDPHRAKKKKIKKKKRGPKHGHKGFWRKLFFKNKITSSKNIFPKKCPKCGGEKLKSIKVEKRQVIELPEIKPVINEYNIYTGRCINCNQKVKAERPKDCKYLFGPRLMGFISLIIGEMTLPTRKMQKLLKYLNIPISLGSIVNIQKLAGKILKKPYENVLSHVLKQKNIHADETSWKTFYDRKWLIVTTTKDSVAFKIEKSRSQEIFNKIFKGYDGILISDRCPSYNMHKGNRQLCLAHIARDFAKISERIKIEGKIGKRLVEELNAIFKKWNAFKENLLTRKELQDILEITNIRFIKNLLLMGFLLKNTKTSRTCRNLLKKFNYLWTFIYKEEIEPTNNLAERDIRPAVIWRKLSFGTQSIEGEKYVERILSIIGTMKKRNKNPFKYLYHCFQSHIREGPIPSPL